MIKTSFTVKYHLRGFDHMILGVTSIVPNMNGILMFTEDGRNHFIESYELKDGAVLPKMFISYEGETLTSDELKTLRDCNFIVSDCRSK